VAHAFADGSPAGNAPRGLVRVDVVFAAASAAVVVMVVTVFVVVMVVVVMVVVVMVVVVMLTARADILRFDGG